MITDAHECSKFVAFYSPKAYEMLLSSRCQKNDAKGRDRGYRAAPTTSALHPRTALPAPPPQPSRRAGRASGRRKQPVAPGEPGSDRSRGALPAAHSQAQPLPASARVLTADTPQTFPRSLRTLFLPCRGKTCSRSLRAAGPGRRAACLPSSLPPRLARPPKPRRGSRIAPPCRARGSALPTRAPPAPPSPAGGMSAGEAKEYLARREIPQLFEVGEAERGERFPPRPRGCSALGPRGGQRAEGGWKDGAVRGGCGARPCAGSGAAEGWPRAGGAAGRPRLPGPGRAGSWRRGAGGEAAAGAHLREPPRARRQPGGRAPPHRCSGRACPAPASGDSELGVRTAEDTRGCSAEEFGRGFICQVFSRFSSVWEKE